MRTIITVGCLACLVAIVAGCNEQTASAVSSSGDALPVGQLCEITIDAQWLVDRTAYVTPMATRDNVNGSKDSAWGKLVRMTDQWIVLDAAMIQMDAEDGRTTTHGNAGVRDRFEFWIPRDRVLYMRVWPAR